MGYMDEESDVTQTDRQTDRHTHLNMVLPKSIIQTPTWPLLSHTKSSELPTSCKHTISLVGWLAKYTWCTNLVVVEEGGERESMQ